MKSITSGKSILLFLLLFFSASTVTAAYNWKSVIVGGGGFVTGIIHHPSEAGLTYARTDMGGAYRWNTSLNQWDAITDFLDRTNTDYMGILSIALDPSNTDKVYMMCGKYTASWAGAGAILVSNDRGTTWAINKLDAYAVKVGGNEDGRGAGERLAVDPNKGNILFMGTTRNCLWKSIDSGVTWARVTSFAPNAVTHTTVNFVLFDPTTGTAGNPTNNIYVSITNTTNPGTLQTLYRSTDAGATWNPVAGQPAGQCPVRADISGNNMFFAYANQTGPNNAGAGAVWRYNKSTGVWTNLNAPAGQGGFGGVSVDANNPNHILISTFDRWWPFDEVFRTTNGGTTWTPLLATAVFDYSYAPWSASRKPHWMQDIKIDPFDSNKAMFVTGYGIWACDNLSASPTTWYFKNKVLEETVPLDMISPPAGGPLLSAMGDQGGFVHNTLDSSPAAGFYSDNVGTTLGIDFAEAVPAKIVKADDSGATKYGAYSVNGGVNWTAFGSNPAGANRGGSKSIAVSPDGVNIIWMASGAYLSYSTNNGTNWTTCAGGPPQDRYIISDRVNSNKFYYYDAVAGTLWVSVNKGQTFAAAASGLPVLPGWGYGDGTIASPFGIEGHVWITTGAGGLYRSTDSGATAAKVGTVTEAYRIGFGKAATGWTYPAIYLHGIVGGVLGIFRSDDTAATWTRINTNANQYGGIHTVIGDPNIYGRCYVSAEGRGAFYGEPALGNSPTSTPTKTLTRTATRTSTATGTVSSSQTATFTKTHTPTLTQTKSMTATYTFTQSVTGTATKTPSPSFTATRTASVTSTCTNTPLDSSTATASFTPTLSVTYTATRTATITKSSTATVSGTITGTFTITTTNTPGSTPTFTETPSKTQSQTPSVSATISSTPTGTASITASYTATPVSTATITLTATCTKTASPSFTETEFVTFTQTPSETDYAGSPTFTCTATETSSTTCTYTSTMSCTLTKTAVNTFTATRTQSYTATRTATRTVTGTPTPQPSQSFTPTITPTDAVPAAKEPVTVELVWPNPVNPDISGLNIRLLLRAWSKEVTCSIYTVNYRLVRQISWGSLPGGICLQTISHDNLKGMSNGIYYFVVKSTGSNTGSSKIGQFVLIGKGNK